MKITKKTIKSVILIMFFTGVVITMGGLFSRNLTTLIVCISLGIFLMSPQLLVWFWCQLRIWVSYKYEEYNEDDYEWIADNEGYGVD